MQNRSGTIVADKPIQNVRRFDVSEIKSKNLTPQGFLRCPARATRIGIFQYRKADGSALRELRLPEEVFNPDSVNSLGGVPVTNNHPEDMLVSPENAKTLSVGFTSDNITTDNQFINVDVTITDQKAIEDVQNGKQEMSCGYLCDLEETSGEWNGQAYDAIQRNIVYNHLALVDRGRAGPDVRLRLDKSDAIMVDQLTEEKMSQKPNTVSVGGKDYQCDNPDLAAAIKSQMDDYQTQMDGMKKQLDDLSNKNLSQENPSVDPEGNEEHTEEEGGDKSEDNQVDAMKGKMDAMQEELKRMKADAKSVDVSKLVRHRMKIEKVAARFLPETTRFDDMSDLDLQSEVIKAHSPKADLTGKSEIYIQARFDAISEVETKEHPIGSFIVESHREDAETTDPEKARVDSMKKSAELWKQPLSKTV